MGEGVKRKTERGRGMSELSILWCSTIWGVVAGILIAGRVQFGTWSWWRKP